MNIQEFLETYNYAPYDIEEIAEIITDNVDDPKIVRIAQEFLDREKDFENTLKNIGFEFG